MDFSGGPYSGAEVHDYQTFHERNIMKIYRGLRELLIIFGNFYHRIRGDSSAARGIFSENHHKQQRQQHCASGRVCACLHGHQVKVVPYLYKAYTK